MSEWKSGVPQEMGVYEIQVKVDDHWARTSPFHVVSHDGQLLAASISGILCPEKHIDFRTSEYRWREAILALTTDVSGCGIMEENPFRVIDGFWFTEDLVTLTLKHPRSGMEPEIWSLVGTIKAGKPPVTIEFYMPKTMEPELLVVERRLEGIWPVRQINSGQN